MPHNRLAARLNDPRGIDGVQAVAAAEIAVAAKQADSMAEVQRLASTLESQLARMRGASAGDDGADLPALALAADTIAALAGLYNRTALHAAAVSLCRLLADHETPRSVAIRLHVEAIVLLAQGSAEPEGLLAGLRQLSMAESAGGRNV